MRKLTRIRQLVAPLIFVAGNAAFAQEATAPILPRQALALQKRAVDVMRDTVPLLTDGAEIFGVTSGQDKARWGRIFGDEQVGALVAVAPLESNKGEPVMNADLCFLLWKNGWVYKEQICKVPSRTDNGGMTLPWSVMTTKGQGTYVINRVALYPQAEHLAWRCDASSYALAPMPWPRDAKPSISGSSITFTSAEKPGYASEIRRVFSFDGVVGRPLLTITWEESEDHSLACCLVLPEDGSGNANAWRVAPAKSATYGGHKDKYTIIKSPTKDTQAAHEETVMEVDWGRDYPRGGGACYVFYRLTGLGPRAFNGAWDQDKTPNWNLPVSVKVTGLQEAKELLEWRNGHAEAKAQVK